MTDIEELQSALDATKHQVSDLDRRIRRLVRLIERLEYDLNHLKDEVRNQPSGAR